jgi:hypothetical protein
MSLKYQIKETAPFVEFTALSIGNAGGNPFDIIITTEINLHTYCQAIIDKVFELKHSDLEAFITYQISIAKHPEKWLNKFEKLITLNEHLFDNTRNKTKFIKLFAILELQRQKMQSSSVITTPKKLAKKHINAESEERYFSFYEARKQIELFKDDKEKILFLTKEKFEFESANIDFINQHQPDFGLQCQKEIDHIYHLKKLSDELEKTNTSNNNKALPFTKLKINIQINQLVDIFYQFTREHFVDGKPIIDGNTNDIIAFIANSFVDKDGREISPQTIKTMLSPSKTEKRPKPHKRIDIEDML